MSLPDFELGPLELQTVARSEVAVAPATARVHLQNEHYLLRGCKAFHALNGCVAFLRLDRPFAPVVIDTSMLCARSLCSVTALPLEQSDLGWFLQRFLETGRMARRLIFSLEDSMELSLTPHRLFWSHPVGSRGGTHFVLPNLQDRKLLFTMNNNDVISQVKVALLNEESDCSFSWRWAQANHEQRERLVARFKRGDFDSFSQVMRWLTYSQFITWSDQSVVEWMVLLECHKKGDERNEARGLHTYQNISRGSIDFSTSFDFCLDVVHRYFLPFYDKDLERFSVIEHIASVSNFEIYIQVPRPTQHERLDARHRLREWLADKVAPEEIPALLGEA